MTCEKLFVSCRDLLTDHQNDGTTSDLIRPFVSDAPNDVALIADLLIEIDETFRAAFEKKMQSVFLDCGKHPEKKSDALLYRLRLENAIRMLTLFSKSQTKIQIDALTDEEAILWALTTLWTAGGGLWAYYAAEAYLHGRPSALNQASRGSF